MRDLNAYKLQNLEVILINQGIGSARQSTAQTALEPNILPLPRFTRPICRQCTNTSGAFVLCSTCIYAALARLMTSWGGRGCYIAKIEDMCQVTLALAFAVYNNTCNIPSSTFPSDR